MQEKKKPAVQKRAPCEPVTTHCTAQPAHAQHRNQDWKPVVEKHLAKGIITIPVAYQAKRPLGTAWQKTTDPVAAFRERVPKGEKCNIGALLGQASQAMDVDVDDLTACALAPKYLPKTAYRWGRPGKPKSHYLYRCRDKALDTVQFKDPDGTMLIEVRGDGAQSVIPPSVHESGELIAYESEGEPTEASYDDLVRAAGKIAAATLLVQHYPSQGSRNAYVLGMAGMFAHAGWTVEATQEFLTPVVITAGDDEFDSRMTTIRATIEKHAAGEHVTGRPTLAELIGDDVVQLIAKWLDIKNDGAKQYADVAAEVESLVKRAQASPATFVVDVLKNREEVRQLVALQKQHPALFTSLVSSLTTIDGVGKSGAVSLRQAIRAEAKRQPNHEEIHPRFEATDEGTFMRGDPEKPPRRLANFTAKVTQETIYDDGVEQHRHFELEVRLNGRTIACKCSASEFASMNWVAPQCGIEAIIEPGQTTKENLRVAIQSLSEGVKVSHRFTATGWTQDPESGTYCYVHAGGAIGPHGHMANVQTELSGVLSRYSLPAPVEGKPLKKAYRAFRRMLKIAPARVMVPLLAGALRAVFGPADFGLFLVGKTGTGKSELSALVNQFFGAGLNSRNLPGSFTSTGNALEMQAFKARDAVFTIDDFAPSATRYDAQKMQSTADRMIRALGNGACRARLTSDADLRAAKPPRCMVLMSGEDVPQGHSIQARLLILEIERTDIPLEVWKGPLTACQAHAADGEYAALMSTFIAWVAQDYPKRMASFAKIRDELLSTADENGSHKRTNSIEAQLLAAWRMLAWFLKAKKLLDEAGRKLLVEEGKAAIADAAHRQQQFQVGSDEVDRFIEYVRTAIFQGNAHLTGSDAKRPMLNWRLCGYVSNGEDSTTPQGTRIGIYEPTENTVLLNPTSAMAAVGRIANSRGEYLAITATMLGKRLKDRGVLIKVDEARGKNVVRRRLGDERNGYWVLRAEALGLPHVQTMDERREEWHRERQELASSENSADPQ